MDVARHPEAEAVGDPVVLDDVSAEAPGDLEQHAGAVLSQHGELEQLRRSPAITSETIWVL